MSVDAATTGVGDARRRLLFATSASVVGVVVLANVVSSEPLRWGGGTAVCATLLFGYAANRRRSVTDGSIPDGAVGLANGVTLGRGLLVCAVGGFALAPPTWAWLPAVAFGLAVALDAVDGAVARRTRATALGRRLDGTVDGLAVALGSAAAVAFGGLPAWYLLAGAGWVAFVGARYGRRARGEPIEPLRPSRVRGPIGSAVMAVIAAALTPLAPQPWLTATAAVVLGALTWSLGRDWAVVTGRWPRRRGASSRGESGAGD